MNKPFICIR